MDRRGLDFLAANDPDAERVWRSLEARGQPSYFLTWGWMSNWIASLPEAERPALAVMHANDEPTAAFFLAQRRVRRNLVLQSTALYLNGCGIARHDVGLGHNGLLTAAGARRSLAHVLELLPTSWDELHLPAIDRHAFDDLARLDELYEVRVEREELAPFVDLAPVRIATHERAGDVDLEVAADRAHALDIYGELLRLRARRTDAWTESFHRRLILDRLPHGEIQLMRVARDGTTLGCLYNFVHRDRVIAFQAGFDADTDARAICHAVAIDHNALAGHARYDVPDKALATGAERLLWLRVQRSLAWVSIEDAARRWYDSLVGERQLAPA